MTMLRTRWSAVGAAVAITLGAGGVGLVSATQPTGAATLVSIAPCRIIDTRPAFTVGPRSSPLGTGDTHTVKTHGDNGNCTGIPSTAAAVAMNVTAVGATRDTFLTVWAAGTARPTTSSLNPSPGAPPTPNAVTTSLNSDGEFSVFNLAGNVHVLADITGYYVDHDHDDRYYTEAETDALLTGLDGDNIVDGSLSLSDLGGTGIAAIVRTHVLTAPLVIPGGECRGVLTGNFGASVIGAMVIATLADANGDPVLPNSAAVVPTIVIGTTQGGAVPNLLVCSTSTTQLTVPAGSVFTYRLVDG